jgi:type IV pilus assembly protein PilM
MALPFFNNVSKQKDRVLAIDMGGRTTKAVHVQRRGETFALCGYALLDAPIFEKSMSVELLTEHLKAVSTAVDAKTKTAALSVGVNEGIVRHAEMPRMTTDDLRQVLKLNSRNYLQQDLNNHLFDCHVLAPALPAKGADGAKAAAAAQQKQRILITAAKRQLVDDLATGARNAGLVAESIVPAMVAPTNAFERSMPEIFMKEIVALIDLGFKSSSICILQHGEIALSRVVAIGGDKLTSGLAESLGISYAEAEGIKVGMPAEVQVQLENLITPLARELRASIDFYEHQHDKAVTQAFVTGGTARSEFIVQRLQQDLMIECKVLNASNFLQYELTPQQSAEIDQVGPQLSVALGTALAVL